MSHFSLLADPAAYTVSDANLLADAAAREYWTNLFEAHFAQVLDAAKVAYGRSVGRQAELARQQFAQALVSLKADPASLGPRLGVVELCRLREQALRDNGLHDPFRPVKARENKAAAALYAPLVKHLAAVPLERRWELLVRGVFAGNIFDLGSAATMGYATDAVDFEAVLAKIKPRPWLIDHLDRLLEMLPVAGDQPTVWAKCIFFVDNAGADFVLGVMPLARQMAAQGTHIVLAANELPSLNDLTADETVQLVQMLGNQDEELATYVEAGLFEVVSTGNDIPLIDLSNVSDELNQAAEDADLVILEGMGRSVESNLHTKLIVDQIQLCLLKDPSVAARVQGQLFDCVCLYRPYDEDQPPPAQE